LDERTINSSIIKSIQKFEKRIISYHQNLNTSGIWLFLATLGCWSVTDDGMQTLAVVFTGIIFFHRLISGLSSFKLFKSEFKEIEEEINTSSLVSDRKKARLHDLNQIDKKFTSWLRILKYIPAYYLSIIFLAASMAHWRSWY